MYVLCLLWIIEVGVAKEVSSLFQPACHNILESSEVQYIEPWAVPSTFIGVSLFDRNHLEKKWMGEQGMLCKALLKIE